jgi:hypothetical protein
MNVKRIIFLIFVLIALNSYYQPVQANNIRFRHTIVRQINYDEDEITKQIISTNEKILFRELISIKIQVLITDRTVDFNNTS